MFNSSFPPSLQKGCTPLGGCSPQPLYEGTWDESNTRLMLSYSDMLFNAHTPRGNMSASEAEPSGNQFIDEYHSNLPNFMNSLINHVNTFDIPAYENMK